MLRNNLYVYGETAAPVEVPASLNYGQWILHRCIGFNGRNANIDLSTGEIHTYSTLAQQIVDIALSLTRHGVKKGDVIGYCCESYEKLVPVTFGAMCCGAAFTLLRFSGEALITRQVSLTKPALIFCSKSALSANRSSLSAEGCQKFVVFDEATPPDVTFSQFLSETACVDQFLALAVEGWKDVAYIAYSSGSTGPIKAVPHTHLNLCAAVGTLSGEYYKDKVVLVNPYMLPNWVNGVYWGPTLILGYGNNLLKALEKYKVQTTCLFPLDYLTIVKYFERTNYDCGSVQVMFSTGAHVTQDLQQKLNQTFSNVKFVHQGYASSEMNFVCANVPGVMGKPGSVGMVGKEIIIKVMDLDTGKPVGPNRQGELCVRSPSAFKGYNGIPTSDVFDEEGFFKTGDIGYYDDDQCFFIVDRIKQVIKYGGYTLIPSVLEGILTQHPSLSEAAVVGVPSEQFGQLPVAFLVPADGASIDVDDVVNFYNSKVDPMRRIHGGVRVIERLPRLGPGKVDKMALIQTISLQNEQNKFNIVDNISACKL